MVYASLNNKKESNNKEENAKKSDFSSYMKVINRTLSYFSLEKIKEGDLLFVLGKPKCEESLTPAQEFVAGVLAGVVAINLAICAYIFLVIVAEIVIPVLAMIVIGRVVFGNISDAMQSISSEQSLSKEQVETYSSRLTHPASSRIHTRDTRDTRDYPNPYINPYTNPCNDSMYSSL